MKQFRYINNFAFGLVVMLCLSSCATTGLKLNESDVNWHNKRPSPNGEIYHSIYLIGDVGGADEGKSTIPLIELEKHLKSDNRNDKSTDVIFLGDNIYPVGFPPVGHEDRAFAEHRLNVQLESVRGFKGNITFVPGNHDWYTYGREGLKRQEEYIESYLAQFGEGFTDYFRPSNGCGDIERMDISSDISLVTIDSHWLLANKSLDFDMSDCTIKNRTEFVESFHAEMKKLKGRKVLLAMHHPMYTTGKHGGYFRFLAYLMPTTEYKSQWRIPIPLAGAVINYMRPRISEQDTKSGAYTFYHEAIIPPIKEHGETIVAAGHEHTLQYHKVDDVDYIVSGSGSKRGPVAMEDYTKFAYGNYGYALVDYYKDGAIWMSFFANDENDEEFIEVYRTQLK